MSIVPKTSLISVVIPTLNEEASLAETLAQLRNIDGLEVIVADGGSKDRTIALAEETGAMVINSRPGRGPQQNSGAAAATGDILIFLHADTLLPDGFPAMIRNSLDLAGVAAGAFSLAIDLPGITIKFIEKMANWRSRWLQLPYGDQALFVKADTFQQAGGFPEIEIMEDFALLRILGKRGKIRILPATVVTSGRRWQKLGVLRTTLINQAMIIGYFLGRSPASLASWYRRSSRAR
jgi:rSAM/selenodomain-associated transferase 2